MNTQDLEKLLNDRI